MEEYKYVQTYTRYRNTENFQHILRSFRHLLLQMGLSLDEVDKWFSTITSSLDDFRIDSIESIPFSQNMLLELDYSKLNVCASIIIWKDKIGSYLLNEPWIELLVMAKPEDQSYTNNVPKLERCYSKSCLCSMKHFKKQECI